MTSLDLVNAEHDALLMVGYADGVMRLWQDWGRAGHERLVTAWRCFPKKAFAVVEEWRRKNELLADADTRASGLGSGLVLRWCAERHYVYASGDVGFIKVWDAASEACVASITTGSEACVTALRPVWPSVVAAGCGDGTVRVYDVRAPAHAAVRTYAQHRGWVVNVCAQPSMSDNMIMSGGVAGELHFWDMRANNSVMSTQAHQGSSAMNAASLHPYAPLVATGSASQSFKLWSVGREVSQLSTIRYHEGFLGQRLGAISTLCWSPFSHKKGGGRGMLAVGAKDSLISLYSF